MLANKCVIKWLYYIQNGVMFMENYKMPTGLGMALAQRPEAMEKFAALSEAQKQEIINGTRSVSSKAEMRQYVDKIITKY